MSHIQGLTYEIDRRDSNQLHFWMHQQATNHLTAAMAASTDDCCGNPSLSYGLPIIATSRFRQTRKTGQKQKYVYSLDSYFYFEVVLIGQYSLEMQRQKKEQGQRTRQNIIDVTTRLFAARGYAGTSLDLIAKEAQTSKSSIFWHFENKEDLLFTVVDKAMTDWEQEAGSQILAQPDPPSQLGKLIDEYKELAMNRPDTLRLLLGLLLRRRTEMKT